MNVVPPPPSRIGPLTLVNSAVAADTFAEQERWELGYKFAPDACSGSSTFNLVCGHAFSYTPPARPAFVEGMPFGIVAGDRCSTLGFQAEEYEDRSRRLLERRQSYEIAREFWRADIATADDAGDEYAGNQYLTDPASDTLGEGPMAAVAALACLEDALGNERGMIHATRQLATQWAALGNTVLRREGGALLTIHDNIIVTDEGYDGSGPGGTAAGDSQWAYATGLVSVRVGAIVVPMSFSEAIDRSDNTVMMFAWRPAAVAHDGCRHFAVEVDLSRCAVGGAS